MATDLVTVTRPWAGAVTVPDAFTVVLLAFTVVLVGLVGFALADAFAVLVGFAPADAFAVTVVNLVSTMDHWYSRGVPDTLWMPNDTSMGELGFTKKLGRSPDAV
jgi:hypothetical protein